MVQPCFVFSLESYNFGETHDVNVFWGIIGAGYETWGVEQNWKNHFRAVVARITPQYRLRNRTGRAGFLG